jgi:hypothetical protein
VKVRITESFERFEQSHCCLVLIIISMLLLKLLNT